jgi:hypothetical protein
MFREIGSVQAGCSLQDNRLDLVEPGLLRVLFPRRADVGPGSRSMHGERRDGQERRKQHAENYGLRPVRPAAQRIAIESPTAQEPAQRRTPAAAPRSHWSPLTVYGQLRLTAAGPP